jgi:hypothetical protein
MESEDSGELTKVRDIDKLAKGTYYVHIYAPKRTDRAEFTLRLLHKSGAAAHSSNFPAEVPYPPMLAAIPLFDDAPPPSSRPRRPRGDKPPKPKSEPPAQTLKGRISGLKASGGGTRIRIGRGKRDGVEVGWKGVVTTKSGRAINNGRFKITKVTNSESFAKVRATLDAVRSAKYVRLSPP